MNPVQRISLDGHEYTNAINGMEYVLPSSIFISASVVVVNSLIFEAI